MNALLYYNDGESREITVESLFRILQIQDPPDKICGGTSDINPTDRQIITIRTFIFSHQNNTGMLIYKEQINEGDCFPV